VTRVLAGLAVLTVAGFDLFVGSPSFSTGLPENLHAAESVATRFIGGFEGFSYRDPPGNRDLARLATPALAARLRTSPQAAPGPELTAERFVASARVSGFIVENSSASGVRLLAQTSEHISTTRGSTTTVRLVPVSLTRNAAGWRVAAISGIPGLIHKRAHTRHHDVPVSIAPSTGTSTAPPGPVTVSEVRSVGDIPTDYVAWMQGAVAVECPGLPWEVLAGIAKVESDFGESTLPGVASGSNAKGAEGPMQFEPATFRAYATVAPGGADPASPYDAEDAIYSAARLLCADGGGTPGLLNAAIFAYNHSAAYVALVLAYASAYEQESATPFQLTSASGPTRGIALGSVVVADAEAYLGTPYVWGGEQPGVGFDCSGLVQWVYAEAGISLPRVAQDQYDAGPQLPAGATLYPGDLVFFGSGPDAVEHVGIYVGGGEMIDAPYTGVDVRFDRVASVSLGFVGATRPEVPDLSTGAGIPVFTPAAANLLSHDSSGSSRPYRSGTPGGNPSTHGAPNPVGPPTAPHHGHPHKHPSGPGGTKGVPTTTTTRPARKGPPTTTTLPTRTTTTTTMTTTTTTAQPKPVKTSPSTLPPTTTTTTSPPATTTVPSTTPTSPPPHRHHG
jgi:cell wall-associated NlpC family hydrolase